jgi:hypothetical protein
MARQRGVGPPSSNEGKVSMSQAAANVTLPPKGRDYRLDFFRGIANWTIFLDHIPNDALNWITTRNYGFSDAADLFIFISGYTVAFVYGRTMISRGFVIAGTRIVRRAWQIYVAHVMLFVIYIAEIGYLAKRYVDPNLLNDFNVAGFMQDPAETLYRGLILAFKPVNMDVLPLYIVLMLVFPPVLWAMLRWRNSTLAASIAIYLAARQFGWNLAAYPAGVWYFNPFTWQLLFVLGAWFALGGAGQAMPIIKSRWLLLFGAAYLLFAFFITFGGRFLNLSEILPGWLYDSVIPNDKTNLGPPRVIHFVIIAFFVVRFVPRDWRGWEWRAFWPAIVCGQQSLEVFCFGIFLAAGAHFILIEISGTLWMQFLVSVAGIALMTVLAEYRSWSKKQDKPVVRTVVPDLPPKPSVA